MEVSRIVKMTIISKTGQQIPVGHLDYVDKANLMNEMHKSFKSDIAIGECSITEEVYKSGVLNKNDLYVVEFKFESSVGENAYRIDRGKIEDCKIEFTLVPKEGDIREFNLTNVKLILFAFSTKEIIWES